MHPFFYWKICPVPISFDLSMSINGCSALVVCSLSYANFGSLQFPAVGTRVIYPLVNLVPSLESVSFADASTLRPLCTLKIYTWDYPRSWESRLIRRFRPFRKVNSNHCSPLPDSLGVPLTHLTLNVPFLRTGKVWEYLGSGNLYCDSHRSPLLLWWFSFVWGFEA